MTCKVKVPAPLRSYSGGADSIEVGAGTVGEVLGEIGKTHDRLLDKICDSDGRVRGFVNIYLNDVDIKSLGGLDASVREGDEILLVPSIAGG